MSKEASLCSLLSNLSGVSGCHSPKVPSRAFRVSDVKLCKYADGRLVRWDMRAREGAVQDSPVLTYQEGKDYASKTNFNCMATSGALSPARCCPVVSTVSQQAVRAMRGTGYTALSGFMAVLVYGHVPSDVQLPGR